MEYDATLFRSSSAFEDNGMPARSFLDAFDVATAGAVALERMSFGLWQAAVRGDDPRDEDLFPSRELSIMRDGSMVSRTLNLKQPW